MYYVGTPVAVEVTYDSPSLFVGFTLFDWSTGSPVQIGDVIPMTHFIGNSYGGLFTPTNAHPYTVNKAVYTDGTYTIIDDAYSQGSQAYEVVAVPVPGPQMLVGVLRGIIQTIDTCYPNPPACGCPITPQVIIYQSGDTQLKFFLFNPDGSPFNLTGVTEIWAMFQTAINPPVILKLSLAGLNLINAGAGEFSGTISEANALLLKQGLINVEIRVTLASIVYVSQILGQVTVDASLFPAY